MAVAKLDSARGRVAAVVARHERTLLRVARQSSLCHDDALDAYQRALEIFVRRVDTVEPATELAWLKVVVRHEAMAIRRARSESVPSDELDLDAFVPTPDRSVEDQIAGGERVRRSAEALRALKPDEAKALMMKAHGLSYEEIGARNGWSYTKVNRAITEGRRRFLHAYAGIESGAECERYAAIVDALSAGSATTAQILQIRPHLRHCTACRAAVRDLHVSRLRRASLFWPIFVVAEPFGRVTGLRHELAALVHRAQVSDVATSAGLAGSSGGGRIASVATVVGLCLGGATAGTVCVVTGTVPDLGPSRESTRQAAHAPTPSNAEKREPRATRPPPKTAAVSSSSPARATSAPPRQAGARSSSGRSRRQRRASKADAAPREFGFENQAPATSPTPAVATARAAGAAPTAPRSPSSQKLSPAEQEFAP